MLKIPQCQAQDSTLSSWCARHSWSIRSNVILKRYGGHQGRDAWQRQDDHARYHQRASERGQSNQLVYAQPPTHHVVPAMVLVACLFSRALSVLYVVFD